MNIPSEEVDPQTAATLGVLVTARCLVLMVAIVCLNYIGARKVNC